MKIRELRLRSRVLRVIQAKLQSAEGGFGPLENAQSKETIMGRVVILWLAGVPISVIALLYLFGVLH